MHVLGLSAFYHDSAACLLRDGQLVAAAQEERFSRTKHDRRFPLHAAAYCLAEGGLTAADLDVVAFYEDPERKAERQRWLRARAIELGTPVSDSPPDAGLPERAIRERLGFEGPIAYVRHHAAHAASSFLYSGFEQAAIMTVDAVGEWETTCYGRGTGSSLELFEQVALPHSLGLFYGALTAYLGFAVNDGEYKVMGLAAHGQPRWLPRLQRVLASGPRGTFELDPAYVDLASGRAFGQPLIELLGAPPRAPSAPIEAFHADLAASAQALLEEVLLEKVRWLHGRVSSPNLCLAGGVAHNCVANGRLLREGPFERLFVPPAPGDAGGALGAAALVSIERGAPRPDPLLHAGHGPSYAELVSDQLAALGVAAADHRGREAELLDRVIDRLLAGNVVGWFQGRMELGARALGARSLLADPRRPGLREHLNALVKRREAFRPFAPAVLLSEAPRHFELEHASPFMLETCRVRSELALPAITHVDGSARPQTVDGSSPPRFRALLERFFARTGCPILLNTSLNLRDEPIACRPVDALRTQVVGGIELLVLEDFLVERAGVPERLAALLWRAGPARGTAVEPAAGAYEVL